MPDLVTPKPLKALERRLNRHPVFRAGRDRHRHKISFRLRIATSLLFLWAVQCWPIGIAPVSVAQSFCMGRFLSSMLTELNESVAHSMDEASQELS